MKINLDGQTYNLNTKGLFKMALAYLNTKSIICSERGDNDRANSYLNQAFEVEKEFNKFKISR